MEGIPEDALTAGIGKKREKRVRGLILTIVYLLTRSQGKGAGRPGLQKGLLSVDRSWIDLAGGNERFHWFHPRWWRKKPRFRHRRGRRVRGGERKKGKLLARRAIVKGGKKKKKGRSPRRVL